METVLITGCSSGIGEATARAFLDEEWEVHATARDVNDLAVLDEVGCETAALDVTDDEEVDAVVDRVLEESGRIDCVVNNAGYGQFGPLEDVPVDEMRRQFDVNVHGPHRLTRAVLPHMRDRDDGTIVNLSSNLGRIAVPGAGAYCGSKFAVEAMSDALRNEVAGFGVDVVLVEPGPVETRFRERAEREIERGLDRNGEYESLYRLFEDTAAIADGSPFACTPDDVAAVILNAASSTAPAARYTVGPVSKLSIAGGYLPDRWRDAVFGLAIKLAGYR